MDFLSKYMIPLFDTADPAVAAPETHPPPPVVADPAAAPTPPERLDGKLPDAAINEINALRAQKRDLEAAIERARREAADAKAIAERVQRGGENKDFSTLTPPAPVDDAEVDRLAERKLFLRDVEELRRNGLREFGEAFITEGVKPAESAGATDDRIVAEILAVDKANAHRLIKEIGSDWNRARALAQMPSAQRIAEITRMSIAMAAKNEPAAPAPVAPTPPKHASKAPAPPPIIDPGTSKQIDWRSDEADDETFDRGFQEMMKKRMARR